MSNVIGQLGTSNVEVYEFASLANYNSFFVFNETIAFGDTVPYGSATPQYVLTSIFPPNPTSQNVEEVGAHEFGITLNNDAGSTPQSSLPDYTTSIISNFYNMDFLADGTRRPACTASGSVNGPFAGATSEIPAYPGLICSNGTLNAQFFTNGQPWSNSKIAYNTSLFFPSPWNELYAQAFCGERVCQLSNCQSNAGSDI